MSPVHVRAEPGDFAESVLLPGDPLRAKYIAENFFEDAKLVTEERGMLGYTGTYKGEPVSVQATGMGCPSASIVAEEVIQLGAKNLLRVGTCGGYSEELRLGDLIVATSATPNDGTVSSLTRGVPYAPAAHFDIVHAAHHAGESAGRRTFVGPIVSSDLFYDPVEEPCGAVGQPRGAGRRDGGVGDLHDSRDARREGRMFADRLRHHRRGDGQDQRRGAAWRRGQHDGTGARHP